MIGNGSASILTANVPASINRRLGRATLCLEAAPIVWFRSSFDSLSLGFANEARSLVDSSRVVAVFLITSMPVEAQMRTSTHTATNIELATKK